MSCHVVDYTAAVLIPMYTKENIKISELLCGHFNIEEGRKTATFSAYYALLFEEM